MYYFVFILFFVRVKCVRVLYRFVLFFIVFCLFVCLFVFLLFFGFFFFFLFFCFSSLAIKNTRSTLFVLIDSIFVFIQL